MKLLAPALLLSLVVAAMFVTDRPLPPADFSFINRGDVTTLDPQRMSWMQDLRVARIVFEGLVANDVFTDGYDIVPAVAETVPGFENLGWFGLVAPAGTPPAIVKKVHDDTVKVLQSAEVKKRFSELGMAPVGNSPAEFTKAMKEESARWAKVVRERLAIAKKTLAEQKGAGARGET